MAEKSSNGAAMQERILKTADRLFYVRGIRAVGVDTIAAEIGISKRTLYNYFPSKDALIVAYLTRRLKPTETTDLPPTEQILGDFNRLERAFAATGFRGCAFVNAVAELSEPEHAANKLAVAYKEQRRTWFRRLLSQLDVPDSDGLATHLMLLVDGAIAAALVRGDPKMARAAREAALVLLIATGVQISSSLRTARGHSKRRTRL
jgi:AcrR family transcriptional regulator